MPTPSSFYYVRLRGAAGQLVMADDEDRQELERLVALAVERHRARVHAFCWLPRELRLIVQLSRSPLGRFVQSFASPYARRIQQKRAQQGHLFAGTYRALIVDSQGELARLVRHVHRSPLQADASARFAGYRWSWHRSYLGVTALPGLT